MSGERVLGGDACKGGWIGIVLSARNPSLHFAAGISDLVDEAGRDGPLEVIAIDMPIGLPDARPRQAAPLARKAAGPRRASVFVTPVRAALEAGDYESASAMNRRVTGKGVSRQAFGLHTKIREVDRWVRQTRHRVVEVHPEASFAQLAGGPLPGPVGLRYLDLTARGQLAADPPPRTPPRCLTA